MDKLLSLVPFIIVAAAFAIGAYLIPAGSFSDMHI